MTDILQTAAQIAVALVWIAAVHKTYLDGCRQAVESVRVVEYGWYTRKTL